MSNTIVSFGCSWTWGAGAYWDENSVPADHRDHAWSEVSENNAARNILARDFNTTNINYARGGYSNDYNFRMLRELLITSNRRDKSEIIILFGITSTARSEYYNIEESRYQHIKFDDSEKGSLNARYFISHYDHDHEVKLIEDQIIMFNDLLSFYGIPVIWYDTFNTHDYSSRICQLVKKDLLSQMLTISGVEIKESNKWYHLSSWRNDDPRITAGVEHGLLNPVSFHPTKKGQEIIADILRPDIARSI